MKNYIGLKRTFFLALDKLICSLSHKIIFLSETARQEFISSSIIVPEKGVLIFNGSGAGVNLERFKLQETRDYKFFKHQRPLKILFAGRINYDKGIVDFFEICHLCHNRYGIDLEASIVGRIEIPKDHFESLLRKASFPIKHEHWTNTIEKNFT